MGKASGAAGRRRNGILLPLRHGAHALRTNGLVHLFRYEGGGAEGEMGEEAAGITRKGRRGVKEKGCRGLREEGEERGMEGKKSRGRRSRGDGGERKCRRERGENEERVRKEMR